jgi:hypothetical protein
MLDVADILVALDLFRQFVVELEVDKLPERITKDELLWAVDLLTADLVFYRSHSGSVLTTVDGLMRRFKLLGGEVQGGLWSMVRYCITTAMLVLRPLANVTARRYSTDGSSHIQGPPDPNQMD